MTLELWLGLILPLAGAALFLLLLRRTLTAGRGAAAGFLAAILLGPDVLGRIAPEFFESAWIGGQAERRALESAQRMHLSERIAAETAAVDPEVLEKMAARHSEAEAALASALRAEQHRVRRIRAHATGALSFLLLMFCMRRRGPPRSHDGAMLSALNIGLFSAAVPAGIAAVVLLYTGQPAEVILACAAPLAAGGMPRTSSDRDVGDHAEQSGAELIAHAGRIATVLAVPLACGAFLMAARFPSQELWPLLGIGAGLLLPRSGSERRLGAREPDWVIPALLTAIIALTGSLLAPLIDMHVGALVGIMLLTTDGRWLGAVLGAVLPGGRRTLPSMRLAAGAMAAAPAQTAFASILFLSGLLHPAHALGLLAGAVLADVTAPLRRRAADHLAAAESEIDRLRDEDP